jgi:putative transcriptional regulator
MERSFNHLSRRWCLAGLRAAFFAAALTVLSAGMQAVRPAQASGPATDGLVGQFLIAAPGMGDPRFAHAVILLVQHDASGALGIIVNRPVERESLRRLLADIGEPNQAGKGMITIYAGGPMQPELGFVVHSADYHSSDTIAIDRDTAVTASATVLKDIAQGRGPKKFIFALGYAGWGPGQLEAEMDRQAWFTAPADAKLLFDDDRATLWRTALGRRSRSL